MSEIKTVNEMLALFRAEHGLPDDYAQARNFTVAVGPFTLRFPNFRWRQRAITAHDLHHALTGIPCTMRGECMMAAWELGAGRFRHAGATAFCMPLIFLGLVLTPTKTWASYKRGRATTSLHDRELDEALWTMSPDQLKAEMNR